MEVALVTFVGAGLTTLATGFGIAVPDGAVVGGFSLVRFLAAQDNARTKQLVMETVAGMWLDWQASGLPADVAARHVERLPAVMERLRIADEVIIGSIAAASADLKSGHSNSDHHGRRLAAELIAGAREHGALAEADLNEAISFFFLERLYSRLLRERDFIDQLLPSLDAYFHSGYWRSDVDFTVAQREPAEPPVAAAPRALPAEHEDPVSTAAPALAEPAGDPVVASTGQATAPTAATVSESPVAPLGVEASAEIARRIIAIAGPEGEAGETRRGAHEAARAGDFVTCERLLGEAEGQDLRAAQADLPNVRMHLAAAVETRLVRARIAELGGDGKRAARHYSAAQRYLPTKDIEGRLRLVEQQVLALMRHGEQHDDTEALEQAIASSGAAVDMIGPASDIKAKAGWQLLQARLLLALGQRVGRAEHFEEAVRAANAAAAAWQSSQSLSEWAEARLVAGHALRAQGDQISSVGVLGEAEAAYRATLGVFARDRSPENWVAAAAGLGQVLVRLAELGGGLDRFAEGAQHIASAIDVADRLEISIDRAAFYLARGNALLALYAEQGSEHLAADAVVAFRRALDVCDHDRFSRQALAIRHRLGMALWAVGSRTQSTDTIGAAAEELVAVLDEAERIEDLSRAEQVREDLRLLYEDLAAASAAETDELRRIA